MSRRHKPLVCQFIEHLPSSSFEKYRDTIRTMVHRRHGVYALYRKRRLYYVGLASNLRGRLRQHLRDRHAAKWDTFSAYLTLDDAHIRELESLVVRIASPDGNKQRGKFRRADNLMKSLKRDVRARYRDEIDSLGSRGGGRQPRVTNRRRKAKPELGAPVLAGYFGRPTPLRATYKGATYKAMVRKDGSIRHAGKVFMSPSTAAEHVKKHTANGWDFWKYQRAPGQWVLLDELRKR